MKPVVVASVERAGRDVTCEFPAEMAALEPVRAFYEGFGYVW